MANVNEERHQHDETSSSLGVGQPCRGAKLHPSRECASCSKRLGRIFHQKGAYCPSCGYLCCKDCMSKQKQVLPHPFGYGDRPVKICKGCESWFQEALDGLFVFKERNTNSFSNSVYVETPPIVAAANISNSPNRSSSDVQLSKKQQHEDDLIHHRKSEGNINHTVAASSLPSPAEELLQRISRALKEGWLGGSQKEKITSLVVSGRHDDARLLLGQIFSEHYRHKIELPSPPPLDAEEEDFDDGEDEEGLKTRSGHRARSLDAVEWRDRSSRPKSNSVLASQMMLIKGSGRLTRNSSLDTLHRIQEHDNSTNTMEDDDDDDDDTEPRETKSESLSDRGRPRMRADSAELLKDLPPVINAKLLRKSTRSISMDTADLNDMGFSAAASASSLIPLVEEKSMSSSSLVDSPVGSATLPLQSVSSSSSSVPSSTSSSASRRIKDLYPSSVLHFAVYRIESGTNTFRRFSKKTGSTHDRYSLEVSRIRGIVQIRGVFRHRFWTFRCDCVQALRDHDYGKEYLEIAIESGHVTQTLVFQFANERQKLDFCNAVKEWMKDESDEVYHSTNRESESNTLSPPDITEDAGKNTPPLLNAEDIVRNSEAVDGSGVDIVGSTSLESILCTVTTNFVSGEREVNGTSWPASLYLGPDAFDDTDVLGHIRGVVTITNFRVLFVPYERGFIQHNHQYNVSYVPLFAISRVKRGFIGRKNTVTGKIVNAAGLIIKCKDFRSMRLEMEGSSSVAEERTQVLSLLIKALSDSVQRTADIDPSTLSQLQSPSNNDMLTKSFERNATNTPPRSLNFSSPTITNGSFAYCYASNNTSTIITAEHEDGWNILTDLALEYQRQNVDFSTKMWKMFSNQHGELCPTYPSKLLVPHEFTSGELYGVASFRAKRRLPVVTWHHPRHGCVLLRSSQPLLGSIMYGGRCIADQKLLNSYRIMPDRYYEANQSLSSSLLKSSASLGETSESFLPSSTTGRPIYIFDARKVKASTGNRLMGKGGVEASTDYEGSVIYHLNISNIYRMQASYEQLMKLVMVGTGTTDKTYSANLDATRWLEHLHLILEGSLKIARVLEVEKASVLVHCSDGWDRTAQLVSLAQVMVDPFYRTIKGFAVLVEKDWCEFGHKFAERLEGDRERETAGTKWSPIFLQFLDAVWQIMQQFPKAFEFNENFLLHIANSLTSGLYGTFLYDSRLSREAYGTKQLTISVWTPVLKNLSYYTNEAFVETQSPVWPWTAYPMLRLWRSYYYQWHPKYPQCRWLSAGSEARGEINADQRVLQASRSLGKCYFETQGGDDKSSVPLRKLNSTTTSTTSSSHTIVVGSVPTPKPLFERKQGGSRKFGR